MLRTKHRNVINKKVITIMLLFNGLLIVLTIEAPVAAKIFDITSHYNYNLIIIHYFYESY